MRRKLSVVLAVCLCFQLFCGTAAAEVIRADDEGPLLGSYFPDVSVSADYAEAVNALYECGIVTGDENGNFNPDSTITRAEAATMICRLLGVENEAKQASTTAFSDVPRSHWANGYVAIAAQYEIINGYGNGKFGPSDPVTCEQMLKMLVCAYGWQGIAEEQGGWPSGYVSVAREYGYTQNTSQNVGENATRSTVATYIYNTLF